MNVKLDLSLYKESSKILKRKFGSNRNKLMAE
jgi:hypothetical protein